MKTGYNVHQYHLVIGINPNVIINANVTQSGQTNIEANLWIGLIVKAK